MMDEIADPKAWGEFGLAGLVIMALFIFIWVITRQAREERKEWLDAYVVSQELHDKRMMENNMILVNLTAVIKSQLDGCQFYRSKQSS